MKLYRIEHSTSQDGMWTKKIDDDKLVLHYLSDTRLAELPMPHSDLFRKDGLIWKTAVSSVESLSFWFSKQDIIEMVSFGFLVKQFDSELVMIQENQVLFIESSASNIIDITKDFL